MKGDPSLYVGESSRSVQERAGEHWGAARRGEDESHMVRHQKQVHPGAPPQFYFKVISTHRTALSRQVKEAIRIKKRGGAGGVLNSKSEFNRCYIPRMVVEEEEESSKMDRLAREQTEKEETKLALEQMDETWEQRKARERELAAKKRGRVNDVMAEGERKPKRSRRMKYPIVGEDWGEEEEEEHEPCGELEHQGEEQMGRKEHQLCGRMTDRYNSSTILTPSHITDYFAPLNKKKKRMEQFECDDDWESWACAPGQEDAPSVQQNIALASTCGGIESGQSLEDGDGGEEDDSQSMEDDWGDSSGTRYWFLEETERYVGYDPKEESQKYRVQSSTHQEDVNPDAMRGVTEVPDRAGPLPPSCREGIVPTTLCMATGQPDKGQPLKYKQSVKRHLSEGMELDKEMSGS